MDAPRSSRKSTAKVFPFEASQPPAEPSRAAAAGDVVPELGAAAIAGTAEMAKEAMFFQTDTADAPWTVIKSDCKKRARLNAMRYVLHTLPYTARTPAVRTSAEIGKLDPLIVGRAHVVYERGERALAGG